LHQSECLPRQFTTLVTILATQPVAAIAMSFLGLTAHSVSARAGAAQGQASGWVQELSTVWRQFIVAAFDPYRPEQYYMRGPGPAWRAKHEGDDAPENDHAARVD
jgi:hypothetical protein